MFAIVSRNAPLLNRKEISKAFLNYDSVYLVREIETILFPGSVLTIHEKEGRVLSVTTDEYKSVNSLYIDERFVNKLDKKPNARKKRLPSRADMIEKLLRFPKLPYIWGGNAPEGIPELLEYYPPPQSLSPFDYNYWQLKGVDCSGLLYSITNGYTPRNTSEILSAYPEVSILKPLDLIVWKGHMLITLPNQQVIESRQYDGIVISDLTTRLKQIEKHQPKFLRFM
jgi:hypothetical protein